MNKVYKLLTLATEAFPTEEGRHHVMYVDNGVLTICLCLEQDWQSFHLDERDQEKEPELLLEEIKELLLSRENSHVI